MNVYSIIFVIVWSVNLSWGWPWCNHLLVAHGGKSYCELEGVLVTLAGWWGMKDCLPLTSHYVRSHFHQCLAESKIKCDLFSLLNDGCHFHLQSRLCESCLYCCQKIPNICRCIPSLLLETPFVAFNLWVSFGFSVRVRALCSIMWFKPMLSLM